MKRKTTISRLVARKAILEVFGKPPETTNTGKKTVSKIKKKSPAIKAKKTV